MTPEAPEFDADFPEYAELYDEELEEDFEVDGAEEIDLLVRRDAARQLGV